MTPCWGDPLLSDMHDATELRHVGSLTSPMLARWAGDQPADQFVGILAKSNYCDRIFIPLQ